MFDLVTTSSMTSILPLWMLFLLVWSLVWKGFALWKSARNGNRNWFIAILVINTVGILEILYIFFFSKSKKKEVNKEIKTTNY